MISADSTVSVLDGQVVVVYVLADGEVKTQVVNAGERFDPATQQVSPLTEEQKGELIADMAALEGAYAMPQDKFDLPIIYVSPVAPNN